MPGHCAPGEVPLFRGPDDVAAWVREQARCDELGGVVRLDLDCRGRLRSARYVGGTMADVRVAALCEVRSAAPCVVLVVVRKTGPTAPTPVDLKRWVQLKASGPLGLLDIIITDGVRWRSVREVAEEAAASDWIGD